MSKSDKEFLLSSVFLLCFCVSYCATFLFQIPLPRYYPIQHEWMFVKTPGIPSQGWYGQVAFSLLTSLAAGTAAYFFLPKKALNTSALKFTGLMTCTFVLASLVYIMILQFTHWGVF